jgi:hypothetical protein
MKKLLSVLLLFAATHVMAQSITVTPSVTSYSAAGGEITFSVSLTYPANSVVSFSAKPPTNGWKHVSTTGANIPNVMPQANETTDPTSATSAWGWAYRDSFAAAGTVTFSFTASYPPNLDGTQQIVFAGQTRVSSVATPIAVTPIELTSAPTFTTQPQNVTVVAGTDATFTVAARGGPTPTFQWQRSTNGGSTWAAIADGTEFGGTATGTLSVKAPTLAANAHRFRAVATSAGAGSANSNGAILTVTQAPQIVAAPQPQAVIAGGTATFTVNATGSGTITYKWYFTPTGSTTPQLIANATSPILTVANVQTSNVGDYTVVLNNGVGGDVMSTPVALTIVPRLVRVVPPTGSPGAQIVVPVELIATGAENTVSFSLDFDPTLLTYGSSALGVDAAGATLTRNVTQATTGKLSFLIGREPNETFTAGTKTILTITFSIPANTPGGAVSLLSFNDVPTTRRIIGIASNVLEGAFVNGTVNVSSGLEGDINGDGEVDAADWVKLGRIVVGLDPQPSGDLFIKSDIAPRASKGDGAIDAGDWVQLGRYVVGLDPTQSAGGPTVANP